MRSANWDDWTHPFSVYRKRIRVRNLIQKTTHPHIFWFANMPKTTFCTCLSRSNRWKAAQDEVRVSWKKMAIKGDEECEKLSQKNRKLFFVRNTHLSCHLLRWCRTWCWTDSASYSIHVRYLGTLCPEIFCKRMNNVMIIKERRNRKTIEKFRRKYVKLHKLFHFTIKNWWNIRRLSIVLVHSF